MTDHRAVMKQVVDALENVRAAERSEGAGGGSWISKAPTREHQIRVQHAYAELHKAEEALRAALDAPEGDVRPVACPHGVCPTMKNGVHQMTAPPQDAEKATVQDYEEVLADHRRLVRELDVLLNGEEGAAKQASLCDIVAQVAKAKRTGPVAPFGCVTVRRLSQRFENHVDQYQFYPAGQSPYLDNVDECIQVYDHPPTPPQDADTVTVRLTREQHTQMRQSILYEWGTSPEIEKELLALLGDWPAQETPK